MGLANLVVSASICSASSRVGANTTPKGPKWAFDMSSFKSLMKESIGITKDAVLPDPVSATPIKSRPEMAIGIACRWIGVGLEYPMSDITFKIDLGIGDSDQERRGGGTLVPLTVME